MTKVQKKRIYLNQEKDLARVLWLTLVRWGLLSERDNLGGNLKCPLLGIGDKWGISVNEKKKICLNCIFKVCILDE